MKKIILLFFLIHLGNFSFCQNSPTKSELKQSNQEQLSEIKNEKVITPQNRAPFSIIDEMPMFPGCERKKGQMEKKKCADGKMLEFIYKNRQSMNKKGMVVVEFIVEEDGRLSNLKIKRSLSPECDIEAMRIVQIMPRWNPGKLKGIPKRSSFNLPVRF